ncbi:pantoate kinase [Halogranum amylolyticum]|uniref:Pantoate kinase n=1 Tax=Halogranum amylolyticum TaxID=660520 RepID=A0A1H8PQH8_9EURY|nr:pantoate kinase [Halogranum amylolyticum]SEO44011.1 pantoate kinase [Halogranum amylolyticum]
MTDEATAFVPGHVTGFFSAHPADEPVKAGSRGAGVTLSHGVEVTARPSDESTVLELDGDAVSMPPVERVLDALGVDAAVRAETSLPIGAGFGVSGAMALGTALTANVVFDCGRSENELVALAHVAEVQSGTGLGDVVAQARGGVPIRLDPGAPGYGRLDGVPARPDVEYVTFGELPTEAVLSGDTDRLSAAGEDALARLVREPTLAQFMYASRRFAREAGLLTDEVTEAIRAVSDAGGEASMAMLGRTVFALGSGLTDAGYDAVSCRTHPAGATLQ